FSAFLPGRVRKCSPKGRFRRRPLSYQADPGTAGGNGVCEKRRKRRQQFRHDPAETIGFLLFLQNCYSFCYRLVSTGLYPVIRNKGQDEKEAYHEGNIGNKRSGEILRLRRKSGKGH